jgi:hypothetical protein
MFGVAARVRRHGGRTVWQRALSPRPGGCTDSVHPGRSSRSRTRVPGGQSDDDQFVLLPQHPKKMLPPASSIVVRYCPGQSGGGLLARGNISPAGWLGRNGAACGLGCWQPAGRMMKPKHSSRPSVRIAGAHRRALDVRDTANSVLFKINALWPEMQVRSLQLPAARTELPKSLPAGSPAADDCARPRTEDGPDMHRENIPKMSFGKAVTGSHAGHCAAARMPPAK